MIDELDITNSEKVVKIKIKLSKNQLKMYILNNKDEILIKNLLNNGYY